MNNLPKVVTQQRRGRASNPRLLDRKSDALPLSHRATQSHRAFSEDKKKKNVQIKILKNIDANINAMELTRVSMSLKRVFAE